MNPDEVNPVIHSLRERGIPGTAVHGLPRPFFMHFRTNDHAVSPAGGLRAALGRTKVQRTPGKR